MTQAAERLRTAGYMGYVLVAGIAVGAVLRFVNLGGQSLWVDELLTIKNAHVGEPGILSWIVHNLQGPAVSLMTHYMAKLSLSEVVLRLPFAIAGVITIPAVYLLSRELSDSWTALHTAFLAALSPVLIWYSQEVRGYAFVILFSVLATYYLIRYARLEEPRHLVVYAVFLFAGLVSNLTMALLGAVHLLYLLIERRPVRVVFWWLVAVVVVLVAFSPWLNEIAVRVRPERVVTGEEVEPLLTGSRLSVMAVPYSLYTFGVGYSLGPSPRHLQTDRGGALRQNALSIGLAGIVLGVPLVVGLVRVARSDTKLLAVLVAWMALPAAAVTLLAFKNLKVFNPRYLLIALPAFLVLLGHGMAGITGRRYRFYILPVAALLASSIVSYFTVPYYAKDDLRAAASTIRRNHVEGDVIVAVYTAEPLEFYLRDFAGIEVFGKYDIISHESMRARCEQLASSGQRVWLSQCRQWQVDPEGVIKDWFDENLERLKHESYPGVELYLYGGEVTR